MKIYNIILQNQIISRQDLDKNIIQKYLNGLKEEGIQRKYPLSIFYSLSSLSSENKQLQENYNYGLKNIKIFLECEGLYEYNSNDINNFALLFALKNYNFDLESHQKGIDFINNNFIEYETKNELCKWFQEEIKLFKLNLLSFNIKNYENGTIGTLLKELEDIIEIHKEDLIYASQIN